MGAQAAKELKVRYFLVMQFIVRPMKLDLQFLAQNSCGRAVIIHYLL